MGSPSQHFPHCIFHSKAIEYVLQLLSADNLIAQSYCAAMLHRESMLSTRNYTSFVQYVVYWGLGHFDFECGEVVHGKNTWGLAC